AESRVQLLNYIRPVPLNFPVAVVFGHAAVMNPLTSAIEDPGMKLVNELWQVGIATDLIPTSEIRNGSRTVDREGYIRYGDQQYSAVVLYNPEFERAMTASFFERASTGNTRLFRVGNWTKDFDGRPYDGNGALPPAMTTPANDSVLVGWVKQ